MWGTHSSTESSRPPGLDYAACTVCPSLVRPLLLFLADVEPPGPGGMRSSSRSPGLLGLNCALQQLSTPDALACIQDPSYRSMIYGMPGGNPEDTAQDYPGSAQASADLHLQVSPRRTLGLGFPFVRLSGGLR